MNFCFLNPIFSFFKKNSLILFMQQVLTQNLLYDWHVLGAVDKTVNEADKNPCSDIAATIVVCRDK